MRMGEETTASKQLLKYSYWRHVLQGLEAAMIDSRAPSRRLLTLLREPPSGPIIYRSTMLSAHSPRHFHSR
jgi:hypothetical protein